MVKDRNTSGRESGITEVHGVDACVVLVLVAPLFVCTMIYLSRKRKRVVAGVNENTATVLLHAFIRQR